MNDKMRLKRCLLATIILLFCVLIISCNSRIFEPIHRKLIERHSVKDVKLIGFKDSLSICHENDSAKIIIGLSETLNCLENKAKEGKLDPRFDRERITAMKKAISMLSSSKSNIIVNNCLTIGNQTNLDLCDVWGAIDCEILRKILLNGKAQIYNKRTHDYETRILIVHAKFITGDELHEHYYFRFKNGSEFHAQIILI